MSTLPQIEPMGERSILISLHTNEEAFQLDKILDMKNFLEQCYIKGEVEINHAYSSLLVFYHYHIENIYKEVLRLSELLSQGVPVLKRTPRKMEVPVCYDPEFALDLELICSTKNLSPGELITLHTTPLYTVNFIGFLPGFPYLSGLDERLYFPRKKDPRLKIEKGAVGIGGEQTGIYPMQSPGGWQIIGSTPVDLFNPAADPPCPITAGDRLKFVRVAKADYIAVKRAQGQGTYQLKTVSIDE